MSYFTQCLWYIFYHIALLAQQHAMAKHFMDIKYSCEIKSMTENSLKAISNFIEFFFSNTE